MIRLFILLILFSCGSLLAQNRVTFHILDSIHSQAVTDASLMATYEVGGNVKTEYDISDRTGNAYVIIPDLGPNDTIHITINHINYSKNTMVFLWYDIRNKGNIIWISPRSHKIKPIIIKSQPLNPYDTILIDIDTSELIQTNKLTELLEKDRRFQLEDNYLTFNNKPILRILIDRTDVAGSNYINFLHQLSATDFESMEVIQFYFQNPLDQYFDRPEVALRLNTKKNGKIKKAVSVDGSMSQIRFNEVRAQAYAFTPSIKAYINATRHITGASLYNPNPFSRNAYSRSSLVDNYSTAYSTTIPTPDILPFKYYNNKTSTEILYQSGFDAGKYGTNRLAYHYGGIRDRQSNSSGSIVYVPDDSYSYTSDDSFYIREKRNRFENEFKFFKKNVFLNWVTKADLPGASFRRSEEYSGDITELKEDNISVHGSYTGNSQISLVRAINKKNQFQFTSDVGTLKFWERYISANNRNQLVYSTTNPVVDRVKSKLFEFNNTLVIKSKMDDLTYQIAVGNEYYNSYQQLYRTIEMGNNSSVEKREVSLRQKGWYISGTTMNTNQFYAFQYSISARLQHSTYSTIFENEKGDRAIKWLYDLNFSSTYDLTAKMDIKSSLNWTREWSDPEELRPVGFHNADYLFFGGVEGLPLEEYIETSLRIDKNNLFDQFNFNADARFHYYFRQKSFAIHQDLLFGRQLWFFHPSSHFDLNGKFKYKLLDIPMELSVENQFYHFKSSYKLNNVVNTNHLRQLNNQFTADSRWNSYGIIWSLGMGMNLRKSIGKQQFRYHNWKTKLELLYISQNEKWDFKLGYELMKYSYAQTMFHGMDIRIDYYISKKFNFGLYGYNTMNQKHFSFRSDDVYTQNYTTFELVPFQIGVRIHWDIF